VRLREGLGGHIQSWIADGDVDMAIIYLPGNHSLLKTDIVLRERPSFIAPPAFGPLGASFPVQRLAEVPLVLPSHPHGLRILADDLCGRFGKTPQISIECDGSVYITKQLVAENCGCTLLPLASVVGEISEGLLRAVPLSHPEVIRDVAIVSSRNRPPLAGQWALTQAFRHEIARLVHDGLWPDATPESPPA
jgi:LysR family nitrogen assimilation transcriptional regulator